MAENQQKLNQLVTAIQTDPSNELLQSQLLSAIEPLVKKLTSNVRSEDKDILLNNIQYQVLQATPSYDPSKAKYTSYIYSIIRRSTFKFIADEAKARAAQRLNDGMPAPETNPLSMMVAREQFLAELGHLLHAMPTDRYRKIITLMIEGYPHEKVAAKLKISRKTLYNNISSIRKIARDLDLDQAA